MRWVLGTTFIIFGVLGLFSGLDFWRILVNLTLGYLLLKEE